VGDSLPLKIEMIENTPITITSGIIRTFKLRNVPNKPFIISF
jgi:hypothetical protein